MNIYDLIDKMDKEHKTIFDMPLRVTFYARVSTNREVQLNSQENQIQTFIEMIEKNNNWIFVEGYIDTIRGESAANRDNFQRMFRDAVNGKFDLIICKEISRFSRDLIDSISYTRKFFQHNVGIFFTSDNLCTIDKDSELRLGIMASIAQQEVARLSERIKFGHKKAIENGVVMGNSRIFGYRKKDGRLIIDPKEGKMVKLIYQLYATGDYSLRNISDELMKRGFLNHSGNPISHTTIKAIIKNPKNKGYYCGNKVRIIDYRTKQQKFLPEDEWISYKDETGEIVPAIVDEELWERCNQMLSKRCPSKNSGNKGGKRFTSPLSGKIICSHCGKSYHHNSYGHKSSNVKWHWICQSKKISSASCPSFSIKDEEMLIILKKFFNQFISNMDYYIEKYINIYTQQSKKTNTQNEIANIKSELNKLSIKKDKLLDLYTDNFINKNEFKERNDKLSKQIDELQIDLDTILNKKNSIKHNIEQLNIIKDYFFMSISENMSDNLAYELSKNLLNKIIIEPVNANCMNIIFVPQFGEMVESTVTKEQHGMTIGNMTKKMIPIVTMSFARPQLKNHDIPKYMFNIFLQL